MKPGARFFSDWRDVPAALWMWPNFTPREIACKGTNNALVVFAALDALQEARRVVGRPFIILSAYRSPEHNARVGGAPASKHMEGHAFDIVTIGHDTSGLVRALKAAGFKGFGHYPGRNFLHVDLGPERVWEG